MAIRRDAHPSDACGRAATGRTPGRLALALERLHLGGVVTNRDFLVATLRNPAFLAGDTTTDFIERVDPGAAQAAPDLETAAIVAASLRVAPS